MPQIKRKVKKTRKQRAGTRSAYIPAEPKEQGSKGKTSLVFSVFLVIAFVLTLASQIGSIFAEQGADRNLFGPHAAKIADIQSTLFGPVPLLFFLAAFGFFTAWMLRKNFFKSYSLPLGHYAFGLMLLYVFVSTILAIMMPETLKSTSLDFKMASREYAGYIGLFLSKKIIPPIFGQDTDGLFICCVLGIISTSFCFGLRLNHISLFARNARLLLQRILYNMDFSKVEPKITKAVRIPDTGDFSSVRLGEIKPAKGAPFGKLKNSDLTLLAKPGPSPSDETQILASEDATNLDPVERINRQLAVAKDPMEIRRLRDELAEYKRAKDINEWEDIKGGELRIEGLLDKRREAESKELRQAETEELKQAGSEEPEQIENDKNEESKQIEIEKLKEPTLYDEYRIPLLSEILGPVPDQTIDYTEEELQRIGKDIESQLDNFKVKGKVTGIMTGPVITRFEIEPGPGVKVSKFENLSDDLALVLRTASVRVISSIPGKSAIGIELPNRKPQIVFCKEILESPKFTKDPKKIQVVLGKDIMGDAYVTDLTRTPHLLIAGQTGAGKSVCINVLLASILFSKSPEEVRLILVDPKVVELAMYQNIPHLLHPVITSPEIAVQALKWLCVEMDRRYDVLATARVRNIEGFNDKFRANELGEGVAEEERKLMPFIVVIIDELADLMMTAGKEIETSIARIAQKARAVGIHLVLATQRPSVNVITGVIKANLPSRISFKVASYIDSKTILDGVGAEKLLGKGDMLFRSNDNPEPVRIHGAFLKDAEVEVLAKACSSQNVNFERIESFDLGDSDAETEEIKSGSVKDRDPLFWEAARIGLETGELSITTVQRRLSIGFARAGKIVDQLTSEGICSKPNGSKPRKMLMDEEMINNLEKR
jgi:DNA segregation ATPase FtsK/SpoIIIE-like protein